MNEKNGISPLLLNSLSPRHLDERDLIELEMNDLKTINRCTLPNSPAWDLKCGLGTAYLNGVVSHVTAGFLQNDSKEWVGIIDVWVNHKVVAGKKILGRNLYDLKVQTSDFIEKVKTTLEDALKKLE